jgi:hypothetical protein
MLACARMEYPIGDLPPAMLPGAFEKIPIIAVFASRSIGPKHRKGIEDLCPYGIGGYALNTAATDAHRRG